MTLRIKDWHLLLVGWGVLISAIIIRACLGPSVLVLVLIGLAIIIFLVNLLMNYIADKKRRKEWQSERKT